MHTRSNAQYFFFTLLVLTIICTVWIVAPFLSIIILAVALAVVFDPLYKKLTHIFGGKRTWFSALLTVLSFVVIVCGPLTLLGFLVFNESTALYNHLAGEGTYHAYVVSINDSLAKVLPASITPDIETSLTNIFGMVSRNIASIFATTLNTVFSFLLLVLSMFYFLRDGARFRKFLMMVSPLQEKDDEQILSRLRDAINGVVRGYLLIALVQGILIGIGLVVFGVPNAAILGFVGAIASLVPSIGTALISVPVIIYLFVTGNTTAGVGFAIWAGALVGMVDNMLNPYLVSRKVQLPPLIILFAVLGGVSLLGPVGILIGPLVVSLLYALISIYRTEFAV